MWFKEYAFNVLIQPFHFLIYTILVGGAIELAQTSLVYAVIAIYFLVPAEKLLRKFFGFDNAGTLSAAGSFAGGALFSAMINKINRPKPSGDKEGEDNKKPVRKRTKENAVNADQVLLGAGAGGIDVGGGASGGVSGSGGSGGQGGSGGLGGAGGLGPAGTAGGVSGGPGLDPGVLGMGPIPAGLKDPVLKNGKWGLAKQGFRRKNWRSS